MKCIFGLLTLIGVMFWIMPTSGSLTGGPYEIISDTITFGNADPLSSGAIELFGSGGELAVASSTSGGTYDIIGGFQAAGGSITLTMDQSSELGLRQLTTTNVKTVSIVLTVTTDSVTGYLLTISSDGPFRSSGGNTISAVTDGSVTAGQEEYGISVSGSDVLFSDDQKVSDAKLIALASGPATNRTTTVTFKASRRATTPAGDYSHRVTFTAMANP